MLLSIIIVNWNVEELLKECLDSVISSININKQNYEIIVVDNASSDSSTGMVKNYYPDVKLIINSANYGFGKGCNIGYQISKGEYLLLLNPDTKVTRNSIDCILNEFIKHKDAAIIGTRLIDENGKFQRASGGSFPTLFRVASNYLFFNKILPGRILPNDIYMKDKIYGLTDIDWVSGAAMMLRREAVNNNIFDESYFMFGEDMDLCFRVKNNGWRVLYSDNQQVTHYHGKSYKKQTSEDIIAMAHKGPRKFFEINHGKLSLFFYDAIILTGMLFRWIVSETFSKISNNIKFQEQAKFSKNYLITYFKAN